MDSFKRLLEKEQLYIVGVSGGCDSMALLDMLFKSQYQIVVCHVNYHLRDDSDLDQQTVSDYCKKNQIPCFVKEIDPDSYGKDNFQEQARNLRYHFYLETGRKFKTKKVILAHHLDDIIETVVMQLKRNNTKGYLGIKQVSHIFNLEVIRPCLSVKKEYLRNYCHEHHVPYRDDYTNFQTDFTRDYVRNIVLKDYDEAKVAKLLQWKDEHNQRYFNQLKKIDKYLQLYHQNGVIDYTLIPETLLESFIYEIVKEQVYPPLISETLILEIIKQLKSSKPNIEMSLPVNIRFIKEYNNIRVASYEDNHGYFIQYDHLTYDYHKYFYLSEVGHLNEGVYLNEQEFPIVVRTVLPGDEIMTAGGRKKVSRLFINNKIPRKQRSIWPIVVNNQGEIVLVPHLAKNIRYLYLKPNLYVVKL
ncbi:tRNA lysidine(34) synthetase TilS [uncultured Thomasclavelia sp.]|uniref:tRNA lysidine(34) synthetase TilS n=1 Tax=uncultured Thomasclavelia sp. TaxID=3025759 RepID=UPI0025FC797B|nr:tRNA lysidine(34) synthetase TilS [uncultured Thomasclavelia sp.]